MRIALLADGNSPHTLKWVEGLLSRGHEVLLFSLRTTETAVYPSSAKLSFASIEMGQPARGSTYSKIRYLSALPRLRKRLESWKPDVVHAHYATSYGLIGVLSGHRPLCISLWGSDVYDFPVKGMLYAKILSFILKRADAICSTSHDMRLQALKYTQMPIEVVPFGVQLSSFSENSEKPDDVLHFVTAKSLEPIYNIDLAIKAFKKFVEMPNAPAAHLHIAGDGSMLTQLKALVDDLNISHQVSFYGRLAHASIPAFFADKHVLINLSRTESFGVSCLEAAAAKMVVLASNRGGLPEVVQQDRTGILLDELEPERVAEALLQITSDQARMALMGKAGRSFVETRYTFEQSLNKQLEIYTKLIGS